MPGRTSTRSARSSTATVNRKSSAATLKSTRTSAYAVEIPDEGEDTSLRTQICQIFADAQKTTATQRKLVVQLRKVQEACCYEPQNPKKKGAVEEFDEENFNEEIGRCVLRVLVVKKSEPAGDRIIRFLGVFLKRATEEDAAILQQGEEGEETVMQDSPTTRLTSHILSLALQSITAKDKVVRLRAAQVIAHVVNNLDTIDDELFHHVRVGLVKRLRDKESSVRVQAVLGLGRLASLDEEDDDEDSDDDDAAGGILYKLLDIMQNDPSAEVRRTVVMNLPFHPITLKLLLERSRDNDPATRRALYGKLLPALGDFRHLSLVEREKLLRWGLRDRDELVRKAAASLFRERWIEQCAATLQRSEGEEQEEAAPGQPIKANLSALLELLERIDVINSGVEDGIAHQAMREFWAGRPDYWDVVVLDDDFWNQLEPESAFVARTFVEFCQSSDDAGIIEMGASKVPEVVKMAFFVQMHLNRLLAGLRKIAVLDEETPPELEEDCEAQQFVFEQMLHICATLDYADEVGRRQMYQLMREAISSAELPEESTKLAVDVLRATCGSREAGEKDFCNIVFEAITWVRDLMAPDDETVKGDSDEESFHSAQSDISDMSEVAHKKSRGKKAEELDPAAAEAKRIKEILVYQKCLHIAECMLQNVHCHLETVPSLVDMVDTLIIPAIKSHDAVLREAGIKCLGLCTTISPKLTKDNFGVFVTCVSQTSSESLSHISFQALTDAIISNPSILAATPADPEDPESQSQPSVWLKPTTKALLKGFHSSHASIRQIACTSAAKLLLNNILPQTAAAEILKAFTVAYFNPETSDDEAVRQALSYFIPVFCHSRQQNAMLMAQISITVLQKLLSLREDELDEETEPMVSWSIVGGHLSEWTDGRRVFGATQMGLDGKPEIADEAETPHVFLATELLERALGGSCSRDEKKPLLTLLSKLHVSTSWNKGHVDEEKEEALKTLHGLVVEAVEGKIGPDAPTRNFLAKLEIALMKRLGEVEVVTQAPEGRTEAEGEAEAEAEEAETTVLADRTRGTRKHGDADADVTMDEDEDDTVLAEGTRMPLEDDDEDEGDESDESATVGRRSPAATAVTESDIMDELLDSEL